MVLVRRKKLFKENYSSSQLDVAVLLYLTTYLVRTTDGIILLLSAGTQLVPRITRSITFTGILAVT